jgi:hypothetical protein
MADLESSLLDASPAKDLNTVDQSKSEEGSRLREKLAKIIQITHDFDQHFHAQLDPSLHANSSQSELSGIGEFKQRFDLLIEHVFTTMNGLAGGTRPMTLLGLASLKRELQAFVQEAIAMVAALITNVDTAKQLSSAIGDWQSTVSLQLDELMTAVLMFHIKISLQRTPDPDLQTRLDGLLKDFKTALTTGGTEADVRRVLKQINHLLQLSELRSRETTVINLRINSLINKTREKVITFPPELDREVQAELGKLIQTLGSAQVEVSRHADSDHLSQLKVLVDYVEIAINSLTGRPNLVLAQRLRYAAKSMLREIRGGWEAKTGVMRDTLFHVIKPPTKVLFGVLLAIPLSWLTVNTLTMPPVNGLLLSLPALDPKPPQSDIETMAPAAQDIATPSQRVYPFVILMVMTGTFGGVVSILTRIQQFDNPKTHKYEDDFLPVLIGLVKPILGGSFAFFIFLLLSSGVSPIELKGKPSTSYFYGLLTLAFIAGFSERFAPDLISQVEKTYAPPPTQPMGIGLPSTALVITPATATLAYKGTMIFRLSPPLPSKNYQITLTSDKGGEPGAAEAQSEADFRYTAPSPGTVPESKTITITVASTEAPFLSATATVQINDQAA